MNANPKQIWLLTQLTTNGESAINLHQNTFPDAFAFHWSEWQGDFKRLGQAAKRVIDVKSSLLDAEFIEHIQEDLDSECAGHFVVLDPGYFLGAFTTSGGDSDDFAEPTNEPTEAESIVSNIENASAIFLIEGSQSAETLATIAITKQFINLLKPKLTIVTGTTNEIQQFLSSHMSQSETIIPGDLQLTQWYSTVLEKQSIPTELLTAEPLSAHLFFAKRPFHPLRLWNALQEVEGLWCSRGNVWLATRTDFVCRWEQAGQGCELGCDGSWWVHQPSGVWPEDESHRAVIMTDWDESFGDKCQRIYLIAQSEKITELTSLLQGALLTDEEMSLGEFKWALFEDPFPSFENTDAIGFLETVDSEGSDHSEHDHSNCTHEHHDHSHSHHDHSHSHHDHSHSHHDHSHDQNGQELKRDASISALEEHFQTISQSDDLKVSENLQMVLELAHLYCENGESHRAPPLFRRALVEADRTNTLDLETIHGYAITLLRFESPERSLEVLQRGLERCETSLGGSVSKLPPQDTADKSAHLNSGQWQFLFLAEMAHLEIQFEEWELAKTHLDAAKKLSKDHSLPRWKTQFSEMQAQVNQATLKSRLKSFL